MSNDDNSVVKRLINSIISKTSKPVEGEEDIAVTTSEGAIIDPPQFYPQSKTNEKTDEKQKPVDFEITDLHSPSNIDHKLQAYIRDSSMNSLGAVDQMSHNDNALDLSSKKNTHSRPKSGVNKTSHLKEKKKLTKKQKANLQEAQQRLRRKNVKNQKMKMKTGNKEK